MPVKPKYDLVAEQTAMRERLKSPKRPEDVLRPAPARRNNKRWRENNKTLVREMAKRARRKELLEKYGITVEHYEFLSVMQDHLCAICRKPDGTRKLCVDHCHETGRVRGLLCQKCNVGLGYFKDDRFLLGAAINYLARYD